MVIINKGKIIVQGSVTELLNAQDLIVSFHVDNVSNANNLIQNSGLELEIESVEGNSLLVHIAQEKIPVLNKMLCDNNVQVFSIEAKRKLEDYFLKLMNA